MPSLERCRRQAVERHSQSIATAIDVIGALGLGRRPPRSRNRVLEVASVLVAA